jgi:serine protease DegQ
VRLLNDDLRKEKNIPATVSGIYIDNVFSPSPATKAGIKIGDVLQSMNGEPVGYVYEFQRILYRLGIGARVKLGITRGGKRIELPAQIVTRPREATTR